MFINKIIIGIFLCIFQINLIYGCSCRAPHPQVDFCESDFVLVVKPISQETQGFMIKITVDIIQVYKENNYSKPGILSKTLYSYKGSSLCGVELESNQTWLVAGRNSADQNLIDSCQYVSPFESSPKFIIEGFTSVYEKGCQCHIYNSRRDGPFHRPASNTTCPVETSYCYVYYSACMPAKEGICQWIKNDDLNKCLKEEELKFNT